MTYIYGAFVDVRNLWVRGNVEVVENYSLWRARSASHKDGPFPHFLLGFPPSPCYLQFHGSDQYISSLGVKNYRHQHYRYLRLTSLMRKVWEERGEGALNFVARVIRCVLDVIFTTTTDTPMFRI
jgi:hypothetical protein